MSETVDMDAPVTRREMHQALELWAGAIIEKVTASVTENVTASVTEKVTEKLTAMVAASERRLTAMVAASERRLSAAMVAMEERLMTELGRATRASAEELASRITVVDEQYRDLPTRVSRLEAKVFAPAKRKRR
jgi:hypothetical protein